MPKGVVHHLHFDCTEDEEFVNINILSIASISLLILISTFRKIVVSSESALKNKQRLKAGLALLNLRKSFPID